MACQLAGVGLGLAAARRPGSATDRVLSALADMVLALPGLLLVLLPIYLRLERGNRLRTPLMVTLMVLLAVELATRHVQGVTAPLSPGSPWYVLCELTSPRAGAQPHRWSRGGQHDIVR